MRQSAWTRRDFNRLTVAAVGGLMAGSAIGCGDQSNADGDPNDDTSNGELTDAEKILLDDPHVCAGLNTCKGKAADMENDCAGMGTCATATHSSCSGENECKGQGGCGTSAGRNSCKDQGKCAVPLKDAAWNNARSAFEQAMKKAGKQFGPAPKRAS